MSDSSWLRKLGLGAPVHGEIPADLVGQALGRYRLLGRLGKGGMGTVYRAEDEGLGRVAAVKVLPPESLDGPRRRERFLREARVAATVRHPAIATVYEVGEADGVVYIAMELIEGTTLSRRLEGEPLAPDEVLRLGLAIAEGVAAAHRAGVIHRDLKPDNIMVDLQGRPRILDFGLARGGALQDSASPPGSALTPLGAVLGTPGYMSPEQAMGRGADARSDVFSLGVVLYEMATGQRAYGHATPMDALLAVTRGPPPGARTLKQAVPRALERVISRCLEREPDARYRDAGELAEALRAIQARPRWLRALLR